MFLSHVNPLCTSSVNYVKRDFSFKFDHFVRLYPYDFFILGQNHNILESSQIDVEKEWHTFKLTTDLNIVNLALYSLKRHFNLNM